MINNNSSNAVEKIREALEKNKLGLSITDLVRETDVSRGQIRTALAFLLGSQEIVERQTGMTKLYFLKE